VEVIDAYWLFATSIAQGAGERAKPVCALPASDPWMNNILRPIVESAGYSVVDAAAAQAADIVITNADGPAPSLELSANVVRIRSSAEVRGENDDSIYRYDRAGLISALHRHATGKG
jgi:two-component system chemotaxis sensor kinase CheA